MEPKLSLAEINEALQPYQQEKERKLDWEDELAQIEISLQSLRYALEVLDEHVAKEWAEVEAVQNPGWKRFWYQLTGDQDRKLAKEMADWKAAREHRQKLLKQIESINEEQQQIQHQIDNVQDIELPLRELLRLKEAHLLKAPPHPKYNRLVVEQRKIKVAREKLVAIHHTAGPALRSLDLLYSRIRDNFTPGQASDSQRKLYHYLVAIAQPQLHTLGIHLQGTKKMLRLELSFPIREVARFSKHYDKAQTASEQLEIVGRYRRYCQEIKQQTRERDKHFVQRQAKNQQDRQQLLWTL